VSLILLSYSCVLIYYLIVNVACRRYSRFQLLFSARLERDTVISDAVIACTPFGVASYFLCVRDEEIKFLSPCQCMLFVLSEQSLSIEYENYLLHCSNLYYDYVALCCGVQSEIKGLTMAGCL
jgi:hypothetical protein